MAGMVIHEAPRQWHGQSWPGWGYRWLCLDLHCRLCHKADGQWKPTRVAAMLGGRDHHKDKHPDEHEGAGGL